MGMIFPVLWRRNYKFTFKHNLSIDMSDAKTKRAIDLVTRRGSNDGNHAALERHIRPNNASATGQTSDVKLGAVLIEGITKGEDVDLHGIDLLENSIYP